jgi:hypothetical protein
MLYNTHAGPQNPAFIRFLPFSGIPIGALRPPDSHYNIDDDYWWSGKLTITADLSISMLFKVLRTGNLHLHTFMPLNPIDNPQLQGGTWFKWITSFMGLSTALAAFGMVSQAYLGSSIKLLILGSIIETGRRLFQWMIVRFRFRLWFSCSYSC